MMEIKNKAPEAEFCYSWDGEIFSSGTFATLSDALGEAGDYADDQETVHIGKVRRHDNSRFYPDADVIIEHMACQADDVGGEFAENYPDVSSEAQEELTLSLAKVLDEWCEKHGVSPEFYEVYGIQELDLSPADTAS